MFELVLYTLLGIIVFFLLFEFTKNFIKKKVYGQDGFESYLIGQEINLSFEQSQHKIVIKQKKEGEFFPKDLTWDNKTKGAIIFGVTPEGTYSVARLANMLNNYGKVLVFDVAPGGADSFISGLYSNQVRIADKDSVDEKFILDLSFFAKEE